MSKERDARYAAREAEIAASPTLTLLREAMNFITHQNHDATWLQGWKPMFAESPGFEDQSLCLAIAKHLHPEDAWRGRTSTNPLQKETNS